MSPNRATTVAGGWHRRGRLVGQVAGKEGGSPHPVFFSGRTVALQKT